MSFLKKILDRFSQRIQLVFYQFGFKSYRYNLFYQSIFQPMGGHHSHDINYCYTMPNSKESGFSPVYRNSKFYKQLGQSPDPSIKTYRDVIVQSCVQKYPNRPLAGKIVTTKQAQGENQAQREVQSLSHKECFDKAELLGKSILGHKLQFTEKTKGMRFVGIYAKNRIEWLITDFACSLYGLTSVPLYDTLGMENLTYCLNQTEMTTLFLSDATLKTLLSLKDHGNIKNVVLFDRVEKDAIQRANKLGFNVIDFNTLIEEGKNFSNINYKSINVQPEDIYTFSYTSGTTGPPKGAMLSHRNITSFLFAVDNHDIKFNENDVYLSFLPLPHVLERVNIAGLVYVGAYIVFYAGDMLKLKDDCKIARPTFFVAVPRIYNRIVQKVKEQFNEKTGIAKCLVDSGVKAKRQNLQKDGTLTHAFYDTLIFSKVKQAFGGRIRQMVTGSAPISRQDFIFMEILIGAPLYEGYGQTQNTAAAFIRSIDDISIGNLGGIVPNMQFKLADIPEMRYTSDDKDQNGKPTPRGQIWLRGPAIFPGYYKLKDKTDEALTKDGWLKTGDVGVLLEGGRMKLIDRKKNIFKLQQGEYVAPEKVEDIYRKCPFVEEIFVHGQSTQNFCVAVVKPEKQNFMKLAKQKNIIGTYEQLCHSKEMKVLVIKSLFELGKNSGLNTFEQAKNIYLESTPFAEKNILTNTLKLQRFQAKTVYKQQIQKLYQEGELPVK